MLEQKVENYVIGRQNCRTVTMQGLLKIVEDLA